MFIVSTLNGNMLRVVQGTTPVEVMNNYHKAETFFCKAPAYYLTEVNRDGQIMQISTMCNTWGETDTRKFSQETNLFIAKMDKRRNA